jgi:hypothetical protein
MGIKFHLPIHNHNVSEYNYNLRHRRVPLNLLYYKINLSTNRNAYCEFST